MLPRYKLKADREQPSPNLTKQFIGVLVLKINIRYQNLDICHFTCWNDLPCYCIIYFVSWMFYIIVAFYHLAVTDMLKIYFSAPYPVIGLLSCMCKSSFSRCLLFSNLKKGKVKLKIKKLLVFSSALLISIVCCSFFSLIFLLSFSGQLRDFIIKHICTHNHK